MYLFHAGILVIHGSIGHQFSWAISCAVVKQVGIFSLLNQKETPSASTKKQVEEK